METPQTEENAAPSLINHAARFGAILGGISIAIVVIFYVVSLSFLGNWKFLVMVLCIGLGMVIYAGINFRNEGDGFLTYGKAFMHGFAVLAISGLIGTFFNIILYHVVDTDLPQKMTDVIIQNTEEMMTGFGAPQASIDQTVAGMRDEMPGNFTIGGLAYGYVKALIWYAVIALLTSLIVRKTQPVEM